MSRLKKMAIYDIVSGIALVILSCFFILFDFTKDGKVVAILLFFFIGVGIVIKGSFSYDYCPSQQEKE